MNRKYIVVSVLVVAAALFGVLRQGSAASLQEPKNTGLPTISDTTPQEGQTLRADPGKWSGSKPIVFTYQWRRCNAGGQSCVDIPGATGQTYIVQASDVGRTLRVRVTATNARGSAQATSAATAKVAAAPVGGAVPVTAVTPPDRLVVDQVQFSPSPVTSRTAPITVRVTVRDTKGRAVSGALVFLRSTPVVTTTPPETATGSDGSVTFVVRPERDFSIVFRPGYSVQFFVRARKPGDDLLAGVSTRRLVQVAVAPGQ